MPVTFVENELVAWTPLLVCRALILGVQIGEHRLSRRTVAARLWRMFRWWFAWATALPGERFYDFQCDLIVEVAHGTPRRRSVRLVTRQALQYPLVQKLGVDAVFALAPVEPCRHSWATLDRWNGR